MPSYHFPISNEDYNGNNISTYCFYPQQFELNVITFVCL